MTAPCRSRSAEQLGSSSCDARTEIAGPDEFILIGLAAAIAAGNGRGAVRRAATDLVMARLSGEAVIEPDDGHAEMQHVGDERKQCRFLPAMLGGR